VQEHQRRPVTAAHEADAAARDFNHLVGVIGHFAQILPVGYTFARMGEAMLT
jgi:hypothetical protein